VAPPPHPSIYEIEDRNHLGSIWDAARIAGVKPDTIRVWESRGKIERMPLGDGEAIYHLPTVAAAAASRTARFTPSDPAANARGPHRHTRAA
jgi:hypothetical protein